MGESENRNALDAGSDDRARRVLELEQAFSRGNHRRTRALAEKLAGSNDPALRSIAEDYLERLRPDPGILRLLAGSFLFLLLLTAYVYSVGR